MTSVSIGDVAATARTDVQASSVVGGVASEQAPDTRVRLTDVGNVSVVKDQLEKALDRLNNTARAFNTNLHFSTDEETGAIVVKVIDTTTGEIIRRIPPTRVLEVSASVQATVGLMLDLRA